MKKKDITWKDLSWSKIENIFKAFEEAGLTPQDIIRLANNKSLLANKMNNLKVDSVEAKKTDIDIKLDELFAGTDNYFGIYDWQKFFPAYRLSKENLAPDFETLERVLKLPSPLTEGNLIRDDYFLIYLPKSLNGSLTTFGSFISLFPATGHNGFLKFSPEFYPDHEEHRDRFNDLASWTFSGWSLIATKDLPDLANKTWNKQREILNHSKHYPLKIIEAIMAIQLLLTKKHQRISFAGRTSTSVDEALRRRLSVSIEDNEIIVGSTDNKTKEDKLLLFFGYKLIKPKLSPHS